MTEPRNAPPVALTIAGSDSGGGAGIQADLRTFTAFGVHGVTAITAVTAQNTRMVSAVMTLPHRLLLTQMGVVLDDFPVAAAKIGMLGSAGLVRACAQGLGLHPQLPVIVDPVLVATTGASLGRGGVAAAIRQHLFGRATLLTPNVPEAEQLLGRPAGSIVDLDEACDALLDAGVNAVLLKGGHLSGDFVHDLFKSRHACVRFEHPRIPVEGHGTGCTLSAAIAANLALGASLPDAVSVSVDYVHRALSMSYQPGRGMVSVLDHRRAAP